MSFTRSLKEKTKDIWEECYNHPFLQELGAGTLDKETFMFYLKQDYRYLQEYAKIFALGVTKSNSEMVMMNFSQCQKTVLDEMELHRSYMKSYGITSEDAEATTMSLFNRSYISHMMVSGFKDGLLELMAALLPCPWTYSDFGCRLKEDFADNLEDNYYKSWIETYAGDEFDTYFGWFFETMDQLSANMSEKELERIVDIFKASLEFEYLFWDMSYKHQLSYK